MKTLLLYFLLLILIGEGITLFIMKREKPQDKILAVTTTSVVTSAPTATPTPLALPKPSAEEGTPKPKPTPLATAHILPKPLAEEEKFTSQQINEFIDRFASQYGVSPDVLRYIAICESGFNPSAKNYVYAGLYQFNATTWKNLRLKIGEDTNADLRFNAEEAVQTASYAVSIGDHAIWPHCYP
jgi:soluble lytic murein transglycosylase-like protein